MRKLIFSSQLLVQCLHLRFRPLVGHWRSQGQRWIAVLTAVKQGESTSAVKCSILDRSGMWCLGMGLACSSMVVLCVTQDLGRLWFPKPRPGQSWPWVEGFLQVTMLWTAKFSLVFEPCGFKNVFHKERTWLFLATQASWRRVYFGSETETWVLLRAWNRKYSRVGPSSWRSVYFPSGALGLRAPGK